MLMQQPFEERLAGSRSVLIAGAGGGFDVFCGLPLYFALEASGVKVALSNSSFSNLPGTDAPQLVPGVHRVSARTVAAGSYFPEGLLAQWFERVRGTDLEVFALQKLGVEPLVGSYRAVVDEVGADTIVLIDGGADALLRGDESSLGTPSEDAASIVAVGELDGVRTLLSCVGLGTDTRHGVCHAHVFENMQELTRSGGYLGCAALLPSQDPVRAYLDAYRWVSDRMGGQSASYVSAAVCASIEGFFGELLPDRASSDRAPWCNPLLALQWFFDLDSVLSNLSYREYILHTKTMWEVVAVIEAFRKDMDGFRSAYSIPI